MRAPEASSGPNLERAQPDDRLAPRMLGAGRVPVPALDGDDPVLVGLHAFPRGHVEACLRQRQQCFAVLGKQVRLATSLAVCVHLDVDGFVTISEQSWRSFWTVWSVAE